MSSRAGAAAVFAIFATAAVQGCPGKETREVEDAGRGARIEDVLANPDEVAGTIAIAGEVEDVFSANLFTVGGRDFSGQELLVASTDPSLNALMEDDIVLATGRLERITIVELERSWGVDLEPHVELQFVAKPTLVARSVLVSHRSSPGEPQARAGRP